MKSPLTERRLIVLESTTSTQDDAAECLSKPGGCDVGVILAKHQDSGRGRFGRAWYSPSGESLSMSIIFHEYADHPKPWLLGMAVALAAAGATHVRVQWPNDLIWGGKKVGGILSEVLTDSEGRKIPVVGIGLNLTQTEFPEEIADRATSLKLIGAGATLEIEALAEDILNRLALLPEPMEWSALRPTWMLFDDTPGKRYLLANGTTALAMGIGPDGELIGSVDGETMSVHAADAILG